MAMSPTGLVMHRQVVHLVDAPSRAYTGENAFSAHSSATTTSRWRTWFRLAHWIARAAASGVPGDPIKPIIVGMKYTKVNTRSASAAPRPQPPPPSPAPRSPRRDQVRQREQCERPRRHERPESPPRVVPARRLRVPLRNRAGSVDPLRHDDPGLVEPGTQRDPEVDHEQPEQDPRYGTGHRSLPIPSSNRRQSRSMCVSLLPRRRPRRHGGVRRPPPRIAGRHSHP